MGVSIDLAANWRSLSPLLDEALDLPPEKRTAWLANLPQQHWPLRTILRALLANASEAASSQFLVLRTQQVLQAGRSEQALECAPADVIGPWRLIKKIGEGGMAEVWMAGRCDGLRARPVALKLPRRGWGNRLFCERLARERDILDALNHPNIARLLDAGATTNGQPYLVLEYVQGQRIDEYCRDRRLPVRERLELFLQVAQAIAFAHHSLVLHRDLKPSNILVTSEGAVRVLDFGIAKLLELGQTEETDLTLCAGPAFTLGYASPEQIAGQPLTVASDVYSLGIVLYELLTGVRPYELNPGSAADLEEQLLGVEPAPPSEIVSDKELHRALRGDLDRVVLMALRKLPKARYLSVEHLAADVQRYLQRRPVLARPNRPWYRVSMFVRRHWLALLTITLVLAIFMAASVLTAWQARVALARTKQADEAKALIVSMLLDAHTYKGTGKPVSALDLLRQTQQRLMTLPTSDTRSRVQVLNILGASLLSQQDTNNAEAAAGRAMQEAAKLSPSDPERLRSGLLRNWVWLSRGQTKRIRGDLDRLLEEMRRYGTALPEDLAGAWRLRSAVALEEGDSARAVSSALAALEIAESRLGARHNQSVLALVDLCYAYQSAGQRELALKTGERAVSRALDAYSNSATHPNVLKARVALGQALAGSGQTARGIQQTLDAIEDTSALFGASSRLVGLDLKILAEMEMHAGQWRAAKESIGRSCSILAGHLDGDSPGYASLLKLRSEIELGEAEPDARR
jgi:eukaryotic-like serine/threonine-protein kinase